MWRWFPQYIQRDDFQWLHSEVTKIYPDNPHISLSLTRPRWCVIKSSYLLVKSTFMQCSWMGCRQTWNWQSTFWDSSPEPVGSHRYGPVTKRNTLRVALRKCVTKRNKMLLQVWVHQWQCESIHLNPELIMSWASKISDWDSKWLVQDFNFLKSILQMWASKTPRPKMSAPFSDHLLGVYPVIPTIYLFLNGVYLLNSQFIVVY